MRIKFIKNLEKNKQLKNQIFDLLTRYDKKSEGEGNYFTPPLRERLLEKGDNEEDGLQKYLDYIKHLSFVVCYDFDEVVGFYILRNNYILTGIGNQFINNIFVELVFVRSTYKNKHIAHDIYKRIQLKYPKKPILAKVHVENHAFINVITQFNFQELKRVDDNQNNETDYIYYVNKNRKVSLATQITEYELWGNVYFFGILLLITAFAYFLMLTTEIDIASEIFNSFMTSTLCLLCDAMISYRNAKRDEYLNNLRSYGISSVRFEKGILLEGIIPKAKEEIWVSGYRLIMTSKDYFLESLRRAASGGNTISFKFLIVAPYSHAYKYVYGTENVFINYYKIFQLFEEFLDDKTVNIEIKFTDIPLFNDTYKVDNRIVTSPYLHCTNDNGDDQKITAKDFFTIDIIDVHSDLFDLMKDEYLAVWSNKNDTCTFDLRMFLDCVNKEFPEKELLEPSYKIPFDFDERCMDILKKCAGVHDDECKSCGL